MPRVHGRKAVYILASKDLTTYSNNSTVELTIDKHDTTTNGKNSHVFDGGLLTSNFTLAGFYDSSLTDGPKAVIQPLLAAGNKVAFIHRPEGTGVGLPQDTVSVLIEKYNQTHPVADMVTWSVDLQGSDDVVTSIQ